MDDLRRQIDALREEIASPRRQLAERDARIAELEAELKRRGKRYRPKPSAKKRAKKKNPDRRTKPHRQHEGVFREPHQPDENTIHHDVRPELCPHCGSGELQETGRYEDPLVEDIPEPKIERHRYRRHIQKCGRGGRRATTAASTAPPGAPMPLPPGRASSARARRTA